MPHSVYHKARGGGRRLWTDTMPECRPNYVGSSPAIGWSETTVKLSEATTEPTPILESPHGLQFSWGERQYTVHKFAKFDCRG
jgi:hypothetical protein